MTRTRIALIGCGRILQKHLDGIAANAERAEVVAVCDLVESKASAAGTALGVPFFTDFHLMLQTVPCDLVSILTDSGSHAPITVSVLKDHGVDVLVEKPMALSVEEALEIGALAKEKGLHLIVGHNRRYAPLTRKLLAARPKVGGAMAQYTVSIRPLPAGHWTIDPVEGPMLELLVGANLTDTWNDATMQYGLRQLCGVLTKSPQFMLGGLSHPTPLPATVPAFIPCSDDLCTYDQLDLYYEDFLCSSGASWEYCQLDPLLEVE